MSTILKFSRKQLESMRQDVAENGMSLKKKKAQKILKVQGKDFDTKIKN